MAMIQISNLNPAVETESFLIELQTTDSNQVVGGSNKKGYGYGYGRGEDRGEGRGKGHGGYGGHGGYYPCH